MEGRNRNPPWSDLPQELLSTIANLLTANPISIVTFRSICRSWRFSCPPLSNSSILSPLLPLCIPLSPNSYHPFHDSSRCFYLSVTIIYALHLPRGFSSLSPDTCILFVDEFTSGGGGRRKRLVESLGRLYLVVRCYVDPGHNNKLARLKMVGFNEERKTKFKVYELNEGRKKWIEISSLGDRSFCFGRNFSFSSSVQDLGTCGNDCILFTKHSFLSYSWNEDDYKQFPKFEKGDLDICVYHLHNAEDFGAIESYPGYPDTLWPPPCWIWSIDRVKRIEIVETAINDILERIPENFKAEANRANSGGDPCDDFGKPVVLEFTRGILTLSKMAFDFQEEETKFMNKLRETTDMLNKADKLFELERTSPWVEHDAFKEGKACHGRVLRSILGMLRLRYAHLLYIEEQATQLEMSMNSHIARMLT